MTKSKNDRLAHLILDEEERALEAAFEAREYEELKHVELKKTRQMLQEAAAQYKELNKAKSITARVNQIDLIKFKAKAKSKIVLIKRCWAF